MQSIENGIIDGNYGLAYNTMLSLANDLNSFYGFMASDYLTALSTANILGSGLEATGAVGLGKLAKDGVVAIGKAGAKGASKIANQIEASALTKITENLPKNAMYNKTNGIISIENKNFIQVGTDTLTNSPILREIGYNKGSYTLKGNHYVSTADGLYMIGKNALQKTGTKVVTNSNLAEFMRPGLNPVRNTYHNVLNGYLKNSYQINKDVIDFTESILPGIPSYSDIGYGAAVGAGLYGFYKDWKNDK